MRSSLQCSDWLVVCLQVTGTDGGCLIKLFPSLPYSLCVFPLCKGKDFILSVENLLEEGTRCIFFREGGGDVGGGGVCVCMGPLQLKRIRLG